MEKDNMAYSYHKTLVSLDKEGNPTICDIMDELENLMLSEISQSQKDKYYRIPLI
jgi:hypothetical protein